jgi:hypothetical protein
MHRNTAFLRRGAEKWICPDVDYCGFAAFPAGHSRDPLNKRNWSAFARVYGYSDKREQVGDPANQDGGVGCAKRFGPFC